MKKLMEMFFDYCLINKYITYDINIIIIFWISISIQHHSIAKKILLLTMLLLSHENIYFPFSSTSTHTPKYYMSCTFDVSTLTTSISIMRLPNEACPQFKVDILYPKTHLVMPVNCILVNISSELKHKQRYSNSPYHASIQIQMPHRKYGLSTRGCLQGQRTNNLIHASKIFFLMLPFV